MFVRMTLCSTEKVLMDQRSPIAHPIHILMSYYIIYALLDDSEYSPVYQTQYFTQRRDIRKKILALPSIGKFRTEM